MYPLLFSPIPIERIWGGDYIAKHIHPQFHRDKIIGESLELAGLEGNNSVVRNGFLKGNEINELIEVYMGDLVGDSVYQKFACEFPLIVKILDINDYLSFQVHPSDEMALSRHHAYGKAEAWYILHAEPNASLYLGFNRLMTAADLGTRCMNQTLPEVMNQYTPCAGDCFFIPPGSVHAAGGGLVILEIQQISDITYRVYDWGREFFKESAREMHLDLAYDAIDWESQPKPIAQRTQLRPNQVETLSREAEKLVESPYFYLYKRSIDSPITLSNTFGSSFRLIVCTNGEVEVEANGSVRLKKGDVTLIPASIGQYTITPLSELSTLAEVLEAFIP